MYISAKRFTQSVPNHYSQEASQLLLPAGVWPINLILADCPAPGDSMALEQTQRKMHEGDLLWIKYESKDRQYTAIIFND